jgi:hypothetical protein
MGVSAGLLTVGGPRGGQEIAKALKQEILHLLSARPQSQVFIGELQSSSAT